jgi:hypothetical protein
MPRQKSLASVGVSPPTFSFVLTFVIRAKAALAMLPPAFGLPQLRMEHRVKSVATISDSGLP